MLNVTTVERAYQLALSGECAGIEDIRRRLKSERFEAFDLHLTSRTLKSELRRICQSSYGGRAAYL
jgi:hypothetical protein